MALIEVTNYQKNANGFYFMDIYHPYYGGQNPSWNEFSRRILDLKDGKQIGIDYFQKMLIERKIYDRDFLIVTVPPADPDRATIHGTNLLVKNLFKECKIKRIINGHGFLIRNTKVEKSANGDRSIEKHLGSISIKIDSPVKGKRILLIDDVTTTGNSLIACSKILMNAGCTEVVSMALAQTG